MKRIVVITAVGVLSVGVTPAMAKLVQFRTPSSNIGCIGETLDRDIAKWRRTASERRSRMMPPLSASRLPVGSSARSTDGSLASARATATR